MNTGSGTLHRNAPYWALFEHSPDAVVIIDAARQIVEANRVARETLTTELAELFSPDMKRDELVESFFVAIEFDNAAQTEVQIVDRAGNARVLSLRGVTLACGKCGIIARDVTNERQLEVALAKLRRVDTLGYITASVIHDFNNILTPIIGLSSILANELSWKPRYSSFARELEFAAGRAVDLVRQLHAFVRREPGHRVRANLATVLTEMRLLLERVAGENIDLVLLLTEQHASALLDRSQFEQVVINLVVNARQAMPNGGRLTLSITRVELSAGAATSRDCPAAGEYAAFTVADTGTGIPPDARERLFERFFTTKPGAGSGLGLAGAHRFALQHGGCVAVETSEGTGTTITVYLPALTGTKATPVPSEADLPRGSETVMVVDDDSGVRAVAKMVLTNLGYRVVAAGSGAQAIELAAREPSVALILMDVALPDLHGTVVAAELRSRTDAKVLFMSGHTEDSLRARGIGSATVLLRKAFSARELAHAVRAALDANLIIASGDRRR